MDRGPQFPEYNEFGDDSYLDRNQPTKDILRSTRGYYGTRAELANDWKEYGLEVAHGTDASSAQNIAERGVRTNFRGIQVHGPGLYVADIDGGADKYARGANPQVVAMHVLPNKPIALRHNELANIGSKFRGKSGRSLEQFSDAALGNIALRQKGHDYIHIIEGKNGMPTDFGVVTKPTAVNEIYGYGPPDEGIGSEWE